MSKCRVFPMSCCCALDDIVPLPIKVFGSFNSRVITSKMSVWAFKSEVLERDPNQAVT